MTPRYVFLAPHQDDEVLSMGASIRSHIEHHGGDSVAVVLATTGERSGAIKWFTEGYVPYGHNTLVRDPDIAGSRARFGRCRDAEYVNACLLLGVPRHNIYLGLPGAPQFRDGNPATPAQYALHERIVDAAIERFGRVHYKTMSPRDPSGDHYQLGQALQAAARNGQVASARYYYPPYRMSHANTNGMRYSIERCRDLRQLRWAGNSYGTHMPGRDLYGIGWLSVAPFFGGNALNLRYCTSGAAGPAQCHARPSPLNTTRGDQAFYDHLASHMHL